MRNLRKVTKNPFNLVTIIFFSLLIAWNGCTEDPPTQPPPDDPCEQCPPVIVPGDTITIVLPGIPVICDTTDQTMGYIVKIDQSQPNKYKRVWENNPDRIFEITSTSSAPIDTLITEVLHGYVRGERVSIEKVSGSRAEAVGIEIIDSKCVQ